MKAILLLLLSLCSAAVAATRTTTLKNDKVVGYEEALRLLSLPREIGQSPEDGKPILAGLGRYGPYVQHDKTYASLANIEEAFDVGLNRAITLIAEKLAGGGRGARGPGRAGPWPARRRDSVCAVPR